MGIGSTCSRACMMAWMSSLSSSPLASSFWMLVSEMLASLGDLMPHAARKGFKTSCGRQQMSISSGHASFMQLLSVAQA